MLVGGSAYASGEWYWLITPNPATGTLNYRGTTGSGPLALTARIVNTDPAHELIFDGITLKTDELTPNNPALFAGLWTANPSVEIPEAFTVVGGGSYDFTLGQFSFASAAPGVYKFRLTSAVEYASVAAIPSQSDSGLVTVEVLPVPEPATAAGLAMPLLAVGLIARRKPRARRKS